MTDAWPKQRLFLPCSWCESGNAHTEYGSVEFPPSEDNGPGGTAYLYACEKCAMPSVYTVDDLGGVLDDPFRVWPDPKRFLSRSVPDSLRREFLEAQKCFEAKAYTAVVVMVRRTLEGLTAEHGVTGKKVLGSQLRKMVDDGKLDQRLYQWADMLRVIGNEGAHFTGNPVGRQDAEDTLAMCEAILDNIYVLTGRFDAFKSRRDKSDSEKPQQTQHA